MLKCPHLIPLRVVLAAATYWLHVLVQAPHYEQNRKYGIFISVTEYYIIFLLDSPEDAVRRKSSMAIVA